MPVPATHIVFLSTTTPSLPLLCLPKPPKSAHQQARQDEEGGTYLRSQVGLRSSQTKSDSSFEHTCHRIEHTSTNWGRDETRFGPFPPPLLPFSTPPPLPPDSTPLLVGSTAELMDFSLFFLPLVALVRTLVRWSGGGGVRHIPRRRDKWRPPLT